MIKFENGRHLANYILKILRNTNLEMTNKEKILINLLKQTENNIIGGHL